MQIIAQLVNQIKQLEIMFVNVKLDLILMITILVNFVMHLLIIVLNVILQVLVQNVNKMKIEN